jgi:DNA-binding NarL/FixJ family response regulator
VYEGEKFICEEIKERFLASAMNGNDEKGKKDLTAKEIEIVIHITKGLTSKEIGELLNISNRTVDTHRHNILKKLEIPNAAQLSSWAKEKGYV